MEKGQSLRGMEKLPQTAKHPPVTVSMFSLNAILYTTFSVYKTANHSPRKMLSIPRYILSAHPTVPSLRFRVWLVAPAIPVLRELQQ